MVLEGDAEQGNSQSAAGPVPELHVHQPVYGWKAAPAAATNFYKQEEMDRQVFKKAGQDQSSKCVLNTRSLGVTAAFGFC